MNVLFLSETFCHKPGLIGLYLAIYFNLLFEDLFAAYWGHTLRHINQHPNLVGIHGVHVEFHGIEPFVRVITYDSFRIGHRIIILNDVGCVVIQNDKSILEWYITHSN